MIANVIGKSTTYLPAIHAQAAEFGRSKFEKRSMEIFVCLSAGRRFKKINLESIVNQRHGTQETIPNFTVNHIKPIT